jgi:hypothetical protein
MDHGMVVDDQHSQLWGLVAPGGEDLTHRLTLRRHETPSRPPKQGCRKRPWRGTTNRGQVQFVDTRSSQAPGMQY